MPGLESAVYATIDSCLPKRMLFCLCLNSDFFINILNFADDEIPKSSQNQDGAEKPKSSHTSDYAGKFIYLFIYLSTIKRYVAYHLRR